MCTGGMILITACDDCGITYPNEQLSCNVCGRQLESYRVSRIELELAMLEQESYEQQQRELMAEVDGSWDY